MKFYAALGNPPYQGDNHQQLYPDFYQAAKDVAGCVDMIFPTGWQEPKNANNLSKMNSAEVKEDEQIVLIDNRQNVFQKDVTGAEWTNIILWKKGYDNGLNGNQRVLTNGRNEQIKHLHFDKSQVEKPNELVQLKTLVRQDINFIGMDTEVSVRKPYGLSTDFLNNPAKYDLPPVSDCKTSDDDILIYGLKQRKNTFCYLDKNYPLPKSTVAKNKYKILVGKAWGNFSKSYLGGAYADIVIASPNEVCTENFLECGCFDNYRDASCCAKFVMTKFVRALLYLNKYSQDNSKDKWVDVPVQDYSEDFWSGSISEIDNALMDKYNVPQNIRDFVEKNIQTKTEDNIVNFEEVE